MIREGGAERPATEMCLPARQKESARCLRGPALFEMGLLVDVDCHIDLDANFLLHPLVGISLGLERSFEAWIASSNKIEY